MNHFYLKFVPISNIFNKILDIFSLQIILKPMSNPHQNQTLFVFPKKNQWPLPCFMESKSIAYLIIKMKWYAVDTWMKLWTDFKDNLMPFVSLSKNYGQFINTVFGLFYSYLLCFIFIFVAFHFNHFYFILLYYDCV